MPPLLFHLATSTSCFLAISPLTATFVEVPINVQVPPRIDAKQTGISSFDGLVLSLRATDIVGPMKSDVTAVLFMNPDRPPTTVIVVRSNLFVLPAATRSSQAETTSSTRPSNNAPLMMKIEPRIMMICELNPANACAVSRIPVSTSANSRKMVTKSTGSARVAKSATATTSKPSTMTIGSIAWFLFLRLAKRNAGHSSRIVSGSMPTFWHHSR